MQLQTTLLRILPDHRYRRILIRLMNNLGHNGRLLVDERRIGRGQLGAADGVAAGVFEEEAEEGGDAVHEEADDEEVGDDEDQCAPPHSGGWSEVLLGGE